MTPPPQPIPLIDPYAIYQLLMDYWAETMQDDLYLIALDGWRAGNVMRELVAEKGKKLSETPDLIINKKKYKADLIPPNLIVARYFAPQQAALEQLQAAKDALSQELEALTEEHSGEEGLLAEATTDKGALTKTSLNARLKQLEQPGFDSDPATEETGAELALLKQVQRLMDKESAADKKVKAAQKALDERVFAHYPKLTEAGIKTLVIEDKWQATLQAAIQTEIERVTQHLANRVKLLEERYAEPLPHLVDAVTELSGKVDEHLKRMGLAW